MTKNNGDKMRKRNVMKNKRKYITSGFTLIELLVVILINAIFLMAVLGIYLTGTKYLKESKPVSDVIEEARSGLANLDFLFARKGIGVPPEGDTLTGIPSENNTLVCYSGNLYSSTGCQDFEFYANIKGFAFVMNATTMTNNNATFLSSCRLSSQDDENYYYIFRDGKLINATLNGTYGTVYRFCENFTNNDTENECVTGLNINLILNNASMYLQNTDCNNTNNTIILEPGDIIMKVPYKIRLYVDSVLNYDGYWLIMKATDLATGKSDIVPIARVKDKSSFNVSCFNSNCFSSNCTDCTALKVSITFQSQSKPTRIFKVDRIFSRDVR